jgi:hypothetical protein
VPKKAKHWLADKGRIFGRYIDLFNDVNAMLNDALARDPRLTDDDYTPT